ncbi:LETM1 domain-containing protein 1 isoform X2 [Polistes fuscatus]|uniref:LETM1 domain-containing protein 1 isoform X2 n=1 Tax=Polistes fuscatus TaxID=30207 RepID=UPI001CAA144B|nr:LETM1 domain-containing protein 1 isoform X2 [Polistes fuscatus]
MHKAISRILFYEKHSSICFSYNSVQRYVTQIENNDEKKGKVSNLKKYWLSKYVNYMKRYEATLSKNFPKTMGLYRMFINAYFFPRQMLTHHFWTPEQKIDFTLYYYKERFKYSRPLFHCMEIKSNHIKDKLLKSKWSGIIACLGSGGHPTVESVISCIALFASAPYSLDTLESKHMSKLLGIHELSVWKPFRKRRLKERGMLIKRMDDAILKEGGVTKMSVESLSWAVSFRGLNSVNMSAESMKDWLEQWIMLSTSVDYSTLSLLLHGPILLAYNHNNNLKLLYK